jgi:ABC-type Fe3+/spermidine/putrescine transport system ATPase subunit
VFNAPRSRYVADFVGCSNVTPGVVAGSEDGLVLVDTAIGRLAGVSPAPAPAAGEAAQVMFRPEHGRVVATAAGAGNGFSARVERCVFLGSHVEYHLAAGGHRLLLRSLEGERLDIGTEVAVAVDPRLTRVFADR